MSENISHQLKCYNKQCTKPLTAEKDWLDGIRSFRFRSMLPKTVVLFKGALCTFQIAHCLRAHFMMQTKKACVECLCLGFKDILQFSGPRLPKGMIFDRAYLFDFNRHFRQGHTHARKQ